MELLERLPHLRTLALVATIVGAVVILAWRVRETQRPIDARKILFPPLGMATGFCMFFAPEMRLPWAWGAGAFLAGAVVLAIPLKRTSKLSVVGGEIFLKRSRAFLTILVGLVAVRLALRGYIEDELHVSLFQSGSLFYLLAFGMIVHWRAAMYVRFRELRRQIANAPKSVERAA